VQIANSDLPAFVAAVQVVSHLEAAVGEKNIHDLD
jgi:hypothetical protein